MYLTLKSNSRCQKEFWRPDNFSRKPRLDQSIACQINPSTLSLFLFHNRITSSPICRRGGCFTKNEKEASANKSAAKWSRARKLFVFISFSSSRLSQPGARKISFQVFLSFSFISLFKSIFACKILLSEHWKPLLRYATSSTPPTVNPKASFSCCITVSRLMSNVNRVAHFLAWRSLCIVERRDAKRVSHAD